MWNSAFEVLPKDFKHTVCYAKASSQIARGNDVGIRMGSRLSPCPTTVLHSVDVPCTLTLTCNDPHCGSTIHIVAQALYQKVRPFAIIGLAASHIPKCPYIDPVWSPQFLLRICLQHGRKDSSIHVHKNIYIYSFFLILCVHVCFGWSSGKSRLCSEDVYAALMGRFQARLIFHVVFMNVSELLSLRKQNPSCIAQIHPPAFLPGLWIQTIWSNRSPALQQNSRMISS